MNVMAFVEQRHEKLEMIEAYDDARTLDNSAIIACYHGNASVFALAEGRVTKRMLGGAVERH